MDIGYMAGLYEGEGCVVSLGGKNTNGTPRRFRRPQLLIQMTDKEPLERFVAEYGRGHVLGPYDRTRYGGKWKNMYVLSYGSFEDVQALIALMWSRLSPRRKEQAKEVLRAVQK